ncbi:hypothetical protein Smp_139210 [Schistosoma mansoni]|uniref:hypothetical protein n=1 Tax=Schistosoma mansoni TaxID=6183 RepID=UPI00019B361F|nr:hypothetical protein Smp_139210 [Schistosoma mansoni]|eukprot:XP_018645048.1 hypothetical protein Smp_139210 [Schistosoma mansoni]
MVVDNHLELCKQLTNVSLSNTNQLMDLHFLTIPIMLFYEKIQQNYSDCNQPWNILSEVIKQVKQECFERVKSLEQENLILQQRYKELEERVLPLTKSLNGQQDLQLFLKLLYSNPMNSTTVNFTSTPYADLKNSNTVEQLTNLLLYTNISQKDILLNYHQLHKRVIQLEQINSLLCSILCNKQFISSLNTSNDYPNNENHNKTNDFVQNSIDNHLHQLSSWNQCTVDQPFDHSNTDIAQFYKEQPLNSIKFNWIQSKSLPNLQITNVDSTLNETCLRTNSLKLLLLLTDSSSLIHPPNYTMKHLNEQTTVVSSKNLLKYKTESSNCQLVQNLHLTTDIISPCNQTKHNKYWCNKPLPKGWIQLQDIPYHGLQHETIGTHSHMILGTRSLPLLLNKPIETNWKRTSNSNLIPSLNEGYSHSFRNLHVNNIQLKTIMEVDSGPSINNCIEEKYNDKMNKPSKVYISPNQSIEFLSNSKQILCRDQKLRYHYPLRSTMYHSSNTITSMNLYISRSYDLETHMNYYDTFRKLRNARKDLRFGVFSDTELLTGKFTITSTDDSAIDSGDEDLHICNHSNGQLISMNTDMKRLNNENSNESDTTIVSGYKQKSIEYDNTIQNINPPEVNIVLECRKYSLDPKSLENSSEISTNLSSDSQCNLKVVAPPPVVIYRRRFQKLTSKRMSKFTDRQCQSQVTDYTDFVMIVGKKTENLCLIKVFFSKK